MIGFTQVCEDGSAYSGSKNKMLVLQDVLKKDNKVVVCKANTH